MPGPIPRHTSTSHLDLYSDEEREWLRRIDWLKRTVSPRPTWEEVFAMAHWMGYRKVEVEVRLPKR